MGDRLKSRKFWFTCFWCSMVVFALGVHMITGIEPTYTGQIITFAGTVTAAYTAIQGYADAKGK